MVLVDIVRFPIVVNRGLNINVERQDVPARAMMIIQLDPTQPS